MFLSRITLRKENPQVEFYNKRWENDYEQDVQFMNYERVRREREIRREARQRFNREAVERFEKAYKDRYGRRIA